MALRGGAGSPSDCGVGGFTLGSLDWFLLPVDPDTEELACLPVPRDPDPLRTAAAQGCQQPKPKTRSGTRAQKHARAQVFTNKCSRARRSMHEHKHSSQFPWRHELCDASAPLLVRARAKCVALQPARFRGVQLRQVPRQLRHVLRHWSSQVLPRSPRGVGLHET